MAERLRLHEYYQSERFNPTSFDILTRENLELHRDKRRNLYVNHLAIPEMIWRNANVLEVGCSSGENTLLYAMMGAQLTLVEPVAASLRQLRALFEHYGMADSIKRILTAEIASARLKNSQDIIVAEGFINSLAEKRAVVRKLYRLLRPGGLMILSTNDSIGAFIESFKVAIAKRRCRLMRLKTLDDMVEAIRPFFEEDFESIPHSRPFASWAKDVLLNPIAPVIPSYDFDEIVADLAELDPVFHASWPSYRPANDLRWHKCVQGKKEAMAPIVECYRLRRASYLMGRVLDERSALRMTARPDRVIAHLPEVIKAMRRSRGGNADAVIAALRRVAGMARGPAKKLFTEMLTVFLKPDPATYRKCRLLRSSWGVPHHYIVLTK